jgi:hypothetical protein
MKHLKLFDNFLFDPYNVNKFDTPDKISTNIQDIIKGRLIDLDDKGYTIDVRISGSESRKSDLLGIEIYIDKDPSAMFRVNTPFEIDDIKDDVLSLVSELEVNNMKFDQFTIQSVRDHRNYTFDSNQYDPNLMLEKLTEKKITRLELIFKKI